MSWLQQNGSTLVLFILVTLFVFRGPILMRVFRIKSMGIHELGRRLGENPPILLVDVRTNGEFNESHIKQAILAPLSELKAKGPMLAKQYPGREVAVICRSGNRSQLGSVSLKKAGFETVYNVTGGMINWESQGFPVKK
ncbi:rhodanese-like domain-containing protein [Magnetofaba australis]|uniref:Putative rhodanese n=1 Tax=Magnetofaba australis IT-1 TaxID=1434232 RepID=A0A1Y2K0U9_9PROT|nr:rhodanese-like domain-containing protein [Magnetofaba australis]OSM01673.1 putative rhodanese [Magnetofaba australis IT-1]